MTQIKTHEKFESVVLVLFLFSIIATVQVVGSSHPMRRLNAVNFILSNYDYSYYDYNYTQDYEDDTDTDSSSIVARADVIVSCNHTIADEECKSSVQGRIIGGFDAFLPRWPYLISLQRNDPRPEFKGCHHHYCGATLIHPKVAITAAHCIWGYYTDRRNPFNTFYGKLEDVVNGTLFQEVQAHLVPACRHFPSDNLTVIVGYYHHTEYSPQTLEHDIALLILEDELHPEAFVQYKGINSSNIQNAIEDRGLTIIGWGDTSANETLSNVPSAVRQLQVGQVSQLDTEGCKGKLKDTRSDSYLNEEIMMCAYDQKVDACLGDSGGPLLLTDNSFQFGVPQNDIQVGIVSWGTPKGCTSDDEQDVGVYTRLSYYEEWIDRILDDLGFEIESQALVQRQIDPSNLINNYETTFEFKSQSEYVNLASVEIILEQNDVDKNVWWDDFIWDLEEYNDELVPFQED